MTYIDLINELETTGIPATYSSFKSKQKPPFITVNLSNNNDFMADNINFKEIENFQVELYTAKKHPPTEELIQDKLKELKLPYIKAETYLESEKLRQIVYEIQLI
ncbi:hypothetical protein [Sporohalobacter salinus]|uniref:hypothetical protein n=1 Tax=Sporohalobacter salinus TaxID=1494606 RepID=UPI0019608FF2|nr:hypothetical protein [Sporohalobacter salinus]MBM7624781.1 hypothetical protein [Sporohalobacter salinus]